MTSTLSELAHKHCTDKQPSEHNYTPMYEFWMDPVRYTTKNVLEIGLGQGGSARMWHEYFPTAAIWVVEIKPTVNAEGCTIIMGDQSKPATWDKLPGGFDFVIDDGSHVPEHQIASVNIGFNKLKPGGLWFIEDTHCNFHENFNPTGQDILYKWAMDIVIRQQSNIMAGGDFYRVRNELEGVGRDIIAVHFYKSMVVLEKAK